MTWPNLISLDLVTSMLVISMTFIAYIVALKLFKTLNSSVIFHPILIGALLVMLAGLFSGLTLSEYQSYVAPLNWLLGPVTVALAVPLYQQLTIIYRAGTKALLVIMFGGCVAPLSAIGWFVWFDFSEPVQRSILSKSITTPLAMDTADVIGGIPALAAAIVVLTGIIGVIFSRLIFKMSHCDDQQAQGLALGTISHAIGTAHAQQLSGKTAAFSTLALCINGVLTAIILPTILWLFG